MVDGVHSTPSSVTSGVPQGSILGPLLFLCLVDSVTSRPSPATAIRIYADDIALYRIIRSSKDEAEFQADLDTVADWASEARLAFNTMKSVFVRFSGKQTIPEPPKYCLAKEEIPRKNSVKYLGLHLDSRLTWKEHVDTTVTKVMKRIRYITFLFNRKCQRARITLFNSLVLPLFDYCSVVCCPRLKGLVDDLEGCVRFFLRSICSGPAAEYSSIGRYSNRLRQLEMEPLILERIKASLVLAYKMVFSLVPVSNPFFIPLDPFAAGSSIAGATRAAEALRAHPFPIQLNGPHMYGSTVGASDKSFVSLVSRIWNSLKLNIDAFDSLPSFILALNKYNWSTVRFVVDFMGPYSEYFLHSVL